MACILNHQGKCQYSNFTAIIIYLLLFLQYQKLNPIHAGICSTRDLLPKLPSYFETGCKSLGLSLHVLCCSGWLWTCGPLLQAPDQLGFQGCAEVWF